MSGHGPSVLELADAGRGAVRYAVYRIRIEHMGTERERTTTSLLRRVADDRTARQLVLVEQQRRRHRRTDRYAVVAEELVEVTR